MLILYKQTTDNIKKAFKFYIVEHLSSIGTSVYNNYRLMHRCNVTNMTFAEYHFHKYPTFTIGFGFTYYIIPLLQWIALSLTFSWNYIDVTMMLISKSLTCRLKQIHHRINTMAETVSMFFNSIENFIYISLPEWMHTFEYYRE